MPLELKVSQKVQVILGTREGLEAKGHTPFKDLSLKHSG